MLSRLNILTFSDPRNIWPISISILMHAIFLAVVSMPHAPKIPEFLEIDMNSFPEVPAAPASAGPPAPAPKAAAAPAKANVAAPVAVKPPEMAMPVKNVKVTAPVVQPAVASAVSSGSVKGVAGGVAGGSANGVAGGTGTGGKGAIGTGAGGGGLMDGSFGTANGPAFTYKATPTYPRIARKLHKEGTVVLRITIDERGGLKDVKVVQKAGFGFDEAAVNAVKESKFRPAKQRGIPVACRALWKVKFALAD